MSPAASAPATRGRRLARRAWTTLRHDIGRKLTALLMATALWLVLQNLVIANQALQLEVRSVATQTQADNQAAVTAGVYLIVPDELIVRSVSDRRVFLRVSGLRDEVAGLSMSARLPFTVADLDGADEITLSRPLEREVFDSTARVEPHLTSFRVRPEVLQVTLARRETAEVTLTADNVVTAGPPKDRYLFRISRITLAPSQVRLTGPAKVIEQLVADPSRIKLEPVDIAGRSSNVSKEVGLDKKLVDEGVSFVGPTDKVLVHVPIEPDDVVKDLVRMPIEYRNEAVLEQRNLRATAPKTVDIQVVGPPDEVNSRTDEELRGSIVLVFDWQTVPPTFTTSQASGTVGAYTSGLPDTVRVTDAKGIPEIKIEITFELLTAGAPGG